MSHLLIVGCGYLGEVVGLEATAAGHTVTAVTRSAERAARWRERGWQAVVGDVAQADHWADLPDCDSVLYAVGFDRAAGRSRSEVSVAGLAQVLGRLPATVQRLVFISSTSVYGQDAGEWVDECSATMPAAENGQICVAAEQVVRNWATSRQVASTILRLSGIYGPARILTRIAGLRTGEPLTGSPDSWLNLIYRDDAAAAARQALDDSRTWTSANPCRTYLVSDDQPITRGEYYSRLAELVDAPPPVFDPGQTAKRGSGGMNKRCSNDLAKRELGWSPTYPTIATGLPAALNGTPLS